MSGWGIGEWRDAVEIAQIAVTAAAIVAVLYLRSNFVTRREHEELERRVTACEAKHAAAVTRDDLDRIAQQVNLVQGQQSVFQAEMRAVNRRLDEALPRISDAVRRIEDFLLNNKVT